MDRLVIRREQIEALAVGARSRAWPTAIEKVMWAAHPIDCEVLGDDAVHIRALAASSEARDLGFDEYEEHLRYAHVLFRVGTDTLLGEKFPWARSILGWVDVDNDLKLLALEKKTQMVLGY